MPDYKHLYFELFRANAAAAELLLAAQQRAEAAVMQGEAAPPITLHEGQKNQPAQKRN